VCWNEKGKVAGIFPAISSWKNILRAFHYKGKPAIRAASCCGKKKMALCALQVTPCSHFCHFIYAACVYPRVPYLGQAEMNLPYASSLDGKNYLVSHTFLEEGKWCSSWRPPYSVHLSPAFHLHRGYRSNVHPCSNWWLWFRSTLIYRWQVWLCDTHQDQ
jgi:hypothetical protein